MKTSTHWRATTLFVILCLVPAALFALPRLEADSLVLFGINRATIRDTQGIIPAGEFRLFGRGWDESETILYSERKSVSGGVVEVAFYLDPTIRELFLEYGRKGKSGRVALPLSGYGLEAVAKSRQEMAKLPSPPTRLEAPLFGSKNFLEFRDSSLGDAARTFISACAASARPLTLVLALISGLVGAAFGALIWRFGAPPPPTSALAAIVFSVLVFSIAATMPEDGMLFALPLGQYTQDAVVTGMYRKTDRSTARGRVMMFMKEATPSAVQSITAFALWGPGVRRIPLDSLISRDVRDAEAPPIKVRFSSIPELTRAGGSLYLRPGGFISGWILE